MGTVKYRSEYKLNYRNIEFKFMLEMRKLFNFFKNFPKMSSTTKYI